MYQENPEGAQVIVGSMNMGVYIRHCQKSNSQPVPSQAGADTTRPPSINIDKQNNLMNWGRSKVLYTIGKSSIQFLLFLSDASSDHNIISVSWQNVQRPNVYWQN